MLLRLRIFDKQLLSHSLSVAVIVWEIANHSVLHFLCNFRVHVHNVSVLLSPIMVDLWIMLFIDESLLIRDGKGSRNLCEYFNVVALLS